MFAITNIEFMYNNIYTHRYEYESNLLPAVRYEYRFAPSEMGMGKQNSRLLYPMPMLKHHRC
jgi:hypothetical protein